MAQHRGSRRGFTLVELLVVIGIIALLIGMLMPSLAKARQQSQAVACQANLRSVGQMLLMYAQANKDVLFPLNLGGAVHPKQRWPMVVFNAKTLLTNPTPKVLLCPADEDIGPEDYRAAQQWSTPVEWNKHSYVLNRHIHHDGIRYSKTHKISASDIILMGEKKTSYADYYMHPGQFKQIVEHERHGKFKRSNMLFVDMHVSNEQPAPWRGANGEQMEDDWDILPGRVNQN